MTPLVLTLERFGSFRNKQRFEFPKEPGLYFMTGRNEVEPRLGTNGCGKTTLWNALTWVCFDKAANGLRAGDVANWAEPKSAWVSFEFEHDSIKFEVFRKHSPNQWVLHIGSELADEPVDLTKDETNPLLAMLRLQFATWKQSVLMAQGEQMFLDLKPEPQAALFSEVMGLDRWLIASDRAAKQAKEAEEQANSADRALAVVSGTIAGLGSLTGLRMQHSQWGRDRVNRIAVLNSQADQLDTVIDQLADELDQAAEQIKSAERMQRELLDRRNIDSDLVEKRFKDEQALRTSLAVIDADAKRLEALLDVLEHADECPTCGASDRALEAGAQRTATELVRTKLAAKDEYGKLKRAERDTAKVRDRLRAADDSVVTVTGRMNDARANERRLRIDREQAIKDLDRCEDSIEQAEQEVNPFDAALREASERLKRLEIEREQLQEQHTRATERAALCGFWIRGFKDLRLRQIDASLGELEIEADACLADIGLDDWSLSFEVDKESKSGNVRPGFAVFVGSPHNDRPVPWDSWSGGEKQRLRVAAQEGLSNLIRSGTGTDFPLEVWDEPTTGMNAQGIAELLASLKERARLEQRQIWLIDHHTLGHADFDGVVTVVKDSNGSRFETEGETT